MKTFLKTLLITSVTVTLVFSFLLYKTYRIDVWFKVANNESEKEEVSNLLLPYLQVEKIHELLTTEDYKYKGEFEVSSGSGSSQVGQFSVSKFDSHTKEMTFRTETIEGNDYLKFLKYSTTGKNDVLKISQRGRVVRISKVDSNRYDLEWTMVDTIGHRNDDMVISYEIKKDRIIISVSNNNSSSPMFGKNEYIFGQEVVNSIREI